MDCKKSDCKKFISVWHSSLFGRKFQKSLKGLGYWCVFFSLVLTGYKFFSDGSFSAVLTLSSAFQCFAFAVLVIKVRTQQSVAGLSKRSLALYLTSLVFRLLSTLFYNGYLPVDRSGDWVYQMADTVSLLLIIVLVRWVSKKYVHSYQAEQDTLSLAIPVVVAAVLAVVVHPDLNNFFPADVSWTFALYLETFSMLPQLFMMTKIGGEVEALTSHYVASVAASKFFTFIFWLFSFKELAPRNGVNYAGWAVMIAYLGQLLMFADFFYHYVLSIRRGKSLIIPTFGC